MSTILRIRFPWGRYHGTEWGRHANEARPDWPPAPWRILRALYATWHDRCPDLPAEVVHSLLAGLAAPPDYVCPEARVAHTRHYMPDGAFAYQKIEEGRDKTLDTFVSLNPDAPLYIRWPVDLPPAQRDALARLAEALPYLGRAESICEAQLADIAPDNGGLRYAPTTTATNQGDEITLLAPEQPLDLAALRRSTIPRAPGTRRITYAPAPNGKPADPPPPAVNCADRPTAIRWTYTCRAQPALTAAVTMGHVLRAASQSAYGRAFNNETSPTLSGRTNGTKRSDQHQHAHYLALSDDGKLINSLLIWAPGGLTEHDIQALTQMNGLGGYRHIPDFRPGRLALTGLGDIHHVAPELTGPATTWQSITPFIRPRHTKGHATLEQDLHHQITRELTLRGLPETEQTRTTPGTWLDYRRHRPDQPLNQARHATGLKITLTHPTTGPITLGALSHFGLGLFQPIS